MADLKFHEEREDKAFDSYGGSGGFYASPKPIDVTCPKCAAPAGTECYGVVDTAAELAEARALLRTAAVSTERRRPISGNVAGSAPFSREILDQG